MKLSLASVLVAALAPLTLAACAHVTPSGNSAPEHGSATVAVQAPGTFTRLDVRGPVDVTIHEGRPYAMSVTVDGVPPSAVQTRVDGNTLVVDLDDQEHRGFCIGICAHHESARLDLDVPSLEAIVVDGSGDVSMEGSGAHPRFDIEVKGSGDVAYAGDAESLRCKVDGSGDVKLRGTAKRLAVEIAGSGDVDAHALAAGGGEFDIEGSGDLQVDLHGGDTSIRVRGSGDLVYSGQAKITALDVSGSGDVHQR
jgi:hypothetical protein